MLVAALLAGAALQAPAPPPPPAPPAPPAFAAPPPPPMAPLPPFPPHVRGDSDVMSFTDKGAHVVIIKRRPGEPGDAQAMTGGKDDHVLHFKDPDGRDVTVVTNKAITQADAEKMERDMRARLPDMIREGREHGRAQAEIYRKRALEYGAQARREGDLARKEGDEARREGDLARNEGDKAREYAQVIIKQMKDKDGRWKGGPDGPGDFGPGLDGPGGPHVFVRRFGGADGGDLRALRDEVHALRDEVRALKEQLRSGPVR